MTRYYMIKRSDGKYLAHKGGQKWTSNVKIAHVFDSTKDPRETLDKEKCFGETVTKETMKKEFVKSSDILASIDTPRMKDSTIEMIIVSVYANFGKVRAIKALRLIKNLDLSVAKDTIEKYIPSMEYATNLLPVLIKEQRAESEKICANHAIDL